MSVSLDHVLVLSVLLFVLGLLGVLIRRNLIFMLISIEVMLNAAGLALVTAGAAHGQADGQVFYLFILTMAAAHVAVGLALLTQIHKRIGTLDSDALHTLHDRPGEVEG